MEKGIKMGITCKKIDELSKDLDKIRNILLDDDQSKDINKHLETCSKCKKKINSIWDIIQREINLFQDFHRNNKIENLFKELYPRVSETMINAKKFIKILAINNISMPISPGMIKQLITVLPKEDGEIIKDIFHITK